MPQKIPSSALAAQTTVTAVTGSLASPAATLSGYWKLDQPLKGSLNGNANTASALTPGSKINGYTYTGASDLTLTTTDVGEGTQQYFTAARARGAISVSGSLGYSSSTGIISYTTPNTDGIGEGSTNLFFTPARAVSANTTAISNAIGAAIPTGVIWIWSGSSGSIPTGWHICDGSAGTPDLRNRFVIGAGNSYGVGATGGSTDAIVPYHNHSASDHAAPDHSGRIG